MKDGRIVNYKSKLKLFNIAKNISNFYKFQNFAQGIILVLWCLAFLGL